PVIDLAVTGARGRMGTEILRAAVAEPDLRVVAATVRPGSASVGAFAGGILGIPGLDAPLVGSIEDALGPRPAVVVDFTAPSGTALRLAEGLAEVLHRKVVAGREGPRSPDEIGVAAIRGGDVVGEHTVFFLGDGERVELIHRATSRAQFARGALRAARWIV